MPKPLNLQGRLRKMQANFASDPAQSRGRLHNEKKVAFVIIFNVTGIELFIVAPFDD